ncbi:efflux RND transporter periplasmic adaptor subunit [Methylosinus sp. LW4]|uniref:efflux RND transporter periplasmic adaptor subunit n=1 Tax=Methylosinus sp. LW4 TaxID=136993 RepID=UPI000377C089|nr:efflux RND transporter periplasmic adaptor subunit [Methylosinus sp. LW4]
MTFFARIRRRRGWIILGLTIPALLIWRLLASEPPIRYETARAIRQDIENFVLATGTLQAIRQVDVGTRVTGQLKSLKVGLGEHVHEGQLLAEIDPVLPASELRAARASLANLEAQRTSAISNARRSELELARQRGMMAKSATSRRDFENAEAQALSDKANVLALAAQIDQAESQVDIASANLAYTKITAPIDGDVVGVLAQEGQTVVAAQIVPVLLKLARLDSMTVRTQISEADVINVKVGQRVSFGVMGDSDKRYSAILRAVEPAPQNYSDPTTTQTNAQTSSTAGSGAAAVFYNALFDTPNPDRRLRIGMTAQVSITLDVTKNALTIPATVLRAQEADGRYRLRVIGADGRIENRLVRIGVDNRILAEVVDGLAEGERIVASDAPIASDPHTSARQ